MGKARGLAYVSAKRSSCCKGAPDGIDTAELDDRGITAATLKRLSELGLVAIGRRRIERDPFEHEGAATRRLPLKLTDEQAAAFERLAALAASGDLSYRAAPRRHRQRQDGAVPAARQRSPAARPRRAGAGPGDRADARRRGAASAPFSATASPSSTAVFPTASGTTNGGASAAATSTSSSAHARRCSRRSARSGLIIVDEEHDGSYKQEESPRYHGRDVAIVRGRQAGALVVLGSATPSMESFHNAQNGRYELIALRRRVLDRPMAAVRIVDMREEYAANGPDVILSGALCEAAARAPRPEGAGDRPAEPARLRDRGVLPPVRVDARVPQLQRVADGAQGGAARAVPLLQLRDGAAEGVRQLRRAVPRADRLRHRARRGGNRRAVSRRRGWRGSIATRFAGAARSRRCCRASRSGEIDVLVGTQMLAKGHDFARVTLVGVISADVGLGLADFRAAERTFQLLTQVAGRAGRGEMRGEAIVQTLYPKHYSIRHACRQDYDAFYQDEIRYRRGMKYPPVGGVDQHRGQSADPRGRDGRRRRARQRAAIRSGPYRVLGPAPAPLSRLKGEHRAQFFIKGTQRPTMRKALMSVLATRPEIRRRTIVDVDPVSVL